MGASESVEWKGYEHQLLSDKEPQCAVVEGSEEKGATPVYRDFNAAKDFQMYIKCDDTKEEMTNGYSLFKYGALKHSDKPSIGYRPFADDISERGKYKFDTYEQFYNDVLAVGNGLLALELGSSVNVGIFGINRPEWIISHFANWSQSYTTVALYDTLGAEAVSYIVAHAGCQLIYVEKNKMSKLWDAIDAIAQSSNSKKTTLDSEDTKTDDNVETPKLDLRYVVQWDYQSKYGNRHETVSAEDVKRAEKYGIKLLGLTELMKLSKGGKEENIPKPETMAYIMYTSGTTGKPKGVLMTHELFASTAGAVLRRIESSGEPPLSPEDVHVSFLPLAHSFEGCTITLHFHRGVKVGFWNGDVRKLAQDWKELRPTFILGVPRVWAKTHDKVMAKTKLLSAVRKWVFDSALAASTEYVRNGERSAFYDSVVWSKVAEEAGFDRVRFAATGAAPCPPHVLEFLRVLLQSAIVVQGYGMTESGSASFIGNPDDLNQGHVGIPVDNIEYRLVDAPECGYLTTDKPYPRGEVQMRGPMVMKGYYKNEEATAKTLSKDGWLSSGDIGRINPNRTLSIIDRRKNIFKTAMGEYVASEKIEGEYSKCESIQQIWIYGNSFKSFIIAVVVPDAVWAVPWLKTQDKWSESDDTLKMGTEEFAQRFSEVASQNKDAIAKFIKSEMKAIEKASDLNRFELVKDIFVECSIDKLLQGFTIENETLTPTFKLKRPQLYKKYVESVKELYSNNGEAPKEEEPW